MISMTRFALTFALAAGAALIPAKIKAQGLELQGSFDLPVNAQWSQMKLVPGHYTVKLDSTALSTRLLTLRGPEGTQARAVMAAGFLPINEKNYLRLEEIGGTYVVREFHCGSIGQEFDFHVPKKLAALEAKAAQPEPSQTIVALNTAK